MPVGLIEAINEFLIAIVAFIIYLGLYALFVDDTSTFPRWLEIHDLKDAAFALAHIFRADG